MPKTKRNKNKKKRKNSTKKIDPLKTIYRHHEFGGTYPVIPAIKYAANNRLDNLNMPSDFPSKHPMKDIITKELIRRVFVYLKKTKNQRKLYKTLKIKYNKKTIQAKLLTFSKNKTNLKKLESFYIDILSPKK
tara:strand:- start:295 stop:693 length:399 start_codon:yes stop_codon:yes gene_type:complete